MGFGSCVAGADGGVLRICSISLVKYLVEFVTCLCVVRVLPWFHDIGSCGFGLVIRLLLFVMCVPLNLC